MICWLMAAPVIRPPAAVADGPMSPRERFAA